MIDLKFRHEYKIPINLSDALALRSRLSAVMGRDPNAPDGIYHIRSLYFDTPQDRALLEKINGVNKREKFRLRLYNKNTDFIKLEKKSKINGLCNKQSLVISKEEALRLSSGDIGKTEDSTPPLLAELYYEMSTSLLLPKTVVDYTREAFIFSVGNVRVTIDSDIRTGLLCTDFLNPDCVTLPTRPGAIILEIKWDEFLPSVIRDAVALPSRHTSAFSKYAISRVYG